MLAPCAAAGVALVGAVQCWFGSPCDGRFPHKGCDCRATGTAASFTDRVQPATRASTTAATQPPRHDRSRAVTRLKKRSMAFYPFLHWFQKVCTAFRRTGIPDPLFWQTEMSALLQPAPYSGSLRPACFDRLAGNVSSFRAACFGVFGHSKCSQEPRLSSG